MSNKSIKQLIIDVQCEEGYRKIETATVSIVSSLDKVDNKALRNEIKALPVPLYSNLFLKKREIALEVIGNGGYYL